MKDKITIIMVVVILLLVLLSAVGASYAYFATVNKTGGNDKNLNIVTEDLGSIKWEGTKVFTSGDLLPGECGMQTFTLEKNSASGKGIYEIDLKGILDESFGNDVEITLYKSTDASNNVTIKEGESTIVGDTTKQYYKEDSVVLNGTPEKIYGTKALQNKSQIILEQADFDSNTLQKTTYYLVYCYKNNGNQDNQQGKTFSGEISVRLILNKTSYVIAYDLDGGTDGPSSQVKNHGEEVVLSDIVPTKQNYQFMGWTTTKNGDVEYQAGDVYTRDSDLRLYAVWHLKGKITLLNNSAITGGYSNYNISGFTSGVNWNGAGPNTSRPAIGAAYDYDVTAGAISNNLIDLTLINSINMTVQCDLYISGYGYGIVQILDENKKVIKQDSKVVGHGSTTDPARYIYPTVDVSSLTGNYYIVFGIKVVTNENSYISDYIFVNALTIK